MTEIEYLGTKLITIEVILETLLEELEDREIIKSKSFDKQIIKKLKKLQKEIDNEKNSLDLPILFFGEKGEA